MLGDITFTRGTPESSAPSDVVGKVAVIGSAEIGTNLVVKGITAQTDIKSDYGYGHLPESLIDGIGQNAEYLYAIKVEREVGSVTDVVHAGTGTNTPEITGTPNGGTWPVKIKVTLAGACGVAKVKYSLNDGLSWSDEVLVPGSGLLTLGDTGLTAGWDTEGGDLVLDDVESFWAIAPKAAISDILDGMDQAQSAITPEIIIITDPVTPTAAQNFISRAETYWSAIKPVVMIFNPRERDFASGETIEEYQTALLTEYEDVAGDFILAAAGEYAIADDEGEQRFRPLIGVVAGQAQYMAPPYSIAWVAYGSLHLVDPWTGWQWADYLLLDSARFIHARQYPLLSGCYLQDDQLLTDATSKFANLKEGRVGNEMVRRYYAAAIPLLKGPRPQAGSNLGQASLKTRLTDAADGLIDDGYIDAWSIAVSKVDNKSKVKAGFTPRGSEDEIDITIFVEE